MCIRDRSTITKMSLGCFGVVASNLIKAFAAFQAGSGQASWLWVLGAIAVITVGELYLSPIGLSPVSYTHLPSNNALGTVVQAADRGNVDTVIIGGRVRKYRGKVVGLDMNKVKAMTCLLYTSRCV